MLAFYLYQDLSMLHQNEVEHEIGVEQLMADSIPELYLSILVHGALMNALVESGSSERRIARSTSGEPMPNSS